ncbi:MAG: ABC transporter permease subunit [Deltaproteobacteria bacterium]|nr:ABC transporter permease subunit [Deltaproteobacteria bacterium]
MRPKAIGMLAFREIRAALRGRWFVVGAVAFAALAIAVSQLGMANAARWGISTMDRTTSALLNLVLLFIPLLGIPLGAESLTGEEEDGTLGYLISQPLHRSEVFAGKLLGLCASLTLSITLGFGLAAIWIGWGGSVEGSLFWLLAGGAWLLGIFSVSLGLLIATLARNRMKALAFSIAAWLTLVFLCDFGVLAITASQTLGSNALFAITVANPLQAVKTLVSLFISQRLEVLGPAGIHAVQTVGRPVMSLLLAGSIGLWMAAASSLAYYRFRREDLL